MRQIGLAFTMYAGEHHGYLPYPTTSLFDAVNFAPDKGERNLWFTCIDPYLGSKADQRRLNAAQNNVAGLRAYTAFKQDPIWQTFPDNVGDTSTTQGGIKENSRTIKMNSYLRRGAKGLAKYTDVRHPYNFVLAGDSVAFDITGVVGDPDSSRFSMQVGLDNTNDAYVYLRHRNTANIVFVDGHAANENLPMVPVGFNPDGTTSPLVFVSGSVNLNPNFRSWYSEYADSSGNPVFPEPDGTTGNTLRLKTPAGCGLQRNPKMPLEWSDPPILWRQ